MANSTFYPAAGNYEAMLVEVYGSAVIGASGAVGTVKGGGIASVVKESTAGQYTITLTERFERLISSNVGCFAATATGVVPIAQVLMSPATLQASFKANGALTVQFYDYAGAAANPASGSVVSFRVVVRNTQVGPYDA
jgi:hypothetical protein